MAGQPQAPWYRYNKTGDVHIKMSIRENPHTEIVYDGIDDAYLAIHLGKNKQSLVVLRKINRGGTLSDEITFHYLLPTGQISQAVRCNTNNVTKYIEQITTLKPADTEPFLTKTWEMYDKIAEQAAQYCNIDVKLFEGLKFKLSGQPNPKDFRELLPSETLDLLEQLKNRSRHAENIINDLFNTAVINPPKDRTQIITPIQQQAEQQFVAQINNYFSGNTELIQKLTEFYRLHPGFNFTTDIKPHLLYQLKQLELDKLTPAEANKLLQTITTLSKDSEINIRQELCRLIQEEALERDLPKKGNKDAPQDELLTPPTSLIEQSKFLHKKFVDTYLQSNQSVGHARETYQKALKQLSEKYHELDAMLDAITENIESNDIKYSDAVKKELEIANKLCDELEATLSIAPPDNSFLPEGMIIKVKDEKENTYSEKLFKTVKDIAEHKTTDRDFGGAVTHITYDKHKPEATANIAVDTPENVKKSIQGAIKELIQVFGTEEKVFRLSDERGPENVAAAYKELLAQGVPRDNIRIDAPAEEEVLKLLFEPAPSFRPGSP